ncbi:hypothetical protein EGR_06078 [Echinococcus granulosus]|uniref:FAR1 domain-containing protein n=1 Tax=Echinococcus granulosus TaxID=6210 RepID=W6UE07_ECHGR|nr:hypothetical protein EGR_06078 [Echinococcus granulosus]EUB59086.1 hypothetical protein EGR_06078 [Echinococcus granulosus]
MSLLMSSLGVYRNFKRQGTGVVYTVKKLKSLPEGSELARNLTYEYIRLVCSHHKSNSNASASRALSYFSGPELDCPSYMELCVADNRLKITSYDMLHQLHSNLRPGTANSCEVSQESDEADNCDGMSGYNLTAAFLKFFDSTAFATLAELSDKLHQFESVSLHPGALYVKLNSKRFPEGHPMRNSMVYSNIKYVCYHYGTRVSSATKRKNQRTSKLGCSSQICISYSNGHLRIVSFDMRHNHPVTSESAQLYPRNRRLDKHEQEAVDELLRLPYDNSLVLDIIKKQFGKVCTKTDLKNMRSRLKKTTNGNQLSFIGGEKHRVEREEQLNSTLQEIRDIAEVSNDDLFVQNMSVLKCVVAVWKQGKAAIISEAGDGPGPNPSYQNVYPDDANEILIEYNSPSPYLMSTDTQ